MLVYTSEQKVGMVSIIWSPPPWRASAVIAQSRPAALLLFIAAIESLRVNKSESNRVRCHFLSAFRLSLLTSLISPLYHETSGRDLMVLVIMGACASRVLYNVVLYTLTSLLRLSGLCWHRADFCRSFLNDSMSMLLVFLYDICLIIAMVS